MSKRVKPRPVTPAQYEFYKRRMPEIISRYPELFNKRFPEPLAIGITKQLAEATGMTKKEIGHLLYVWCGRHEYLMMMCSSRFRHGLDFMVSSEISDVHRYGYFKRVNGMRTGTVRRWVRDFETAFEVKPFDFMPDDQNPMLKEGFKRIEPPKYDAKLDNVTISKYLTRYHADGNVSEDTMTTGNHPFRDGSLIGTSQIVRIFEKGGIHFIVTRNTTYRCYGVPEVYPPNLTLKQVKDELAQGSIIQS